MESKMIGIAILTNRSHFPRNPACYKSMTRDNDVMPNTYPSHIQLSYTCSCATRAFCQAILSCAPLCARVRYWSISVSALLLDKLILASGHGSVFIFVFIIMHTRGTQIPVLQPPNVRCLANSFPLHNL